jgi:hypothetical protein
MGAMPRKRTWIAIAVAAVPLSYGVAGLVGGALPANAGWVAPEAGIRIYVEDNGIHTGLVLPVRAAGVDLTQLTPARVLRDPRYAGHGWRSYGWGDRAFYVETPTWSKISVLTVARAALGSDATVMHVDFGRRHPHAGAAARGVPAPHDLH